ncbi:LysR family transcriptional regulator [Shewanella sp. 1CM18E]|uniref:LysR family transcriptional regulator n=1 Tax=Shewanella sp. 1CM18E TaxID=2929169 RepID=UPI0020BD6790|nr:LysR family transcriptional regulator [Shewanella sp. 1CM18E]MCK8044588.1 LysR family transcriptional regulator [Shewanella sp. 1CM18E]
MSYDLNDMLAFLQVVESGSFTLAADQLGIPKANLSRKVSRLEAALDITLLERSTRSQHLTEAGKRFLVHCKRVQEEQELATASISELLNHYKGDLKIGASIATGQQVLRPALANFMRQYPDLNLHLSLINRRVDFIEEGFDVVIRIGQLDDSSLIAKKLGHITRHFYASPDYVANNTQLVDLNSLAQHQLLVINPTNNDPRLTVVSDNGEQQVIKQKPRLLVDDHAMLEQAIIDGLGVGVLPAYLCKTAVETGKLVQMLPQWGLKGVDVYALYPKSRAKIPKVRAFIEFVTKLYADILN